jgi:hypothetical protein
MTPANTLPRVVVGGGGTHIPTPQPKSNPLLFIIYFSRVRMVEYNSYCRPTVWAPRSRDAHSAPEPKVCGDPHPEKNGISRLLSIT